MIYKLTVDLAAIIGVKGPFMKRETLGQIITRRLNDIDMSPAELARTMGQKAQYVSDLMSGKKNNPGKEVIKSLASAIQVSPLVILVALDYLPQEVLGDKKEEGFIQLMRELPKEQQRMMEVFMSAAHKEYVVKPARAKVEDSMEPPRRARSKKLK